MSKKEDKKSNILEATLVEGNDRKESKELTELKEMSDMNMVRKDMLELLRHQKEQNEDLTSFSKKIEEKIDEKLDDFTPGQLISLYTAINKDRNNIAKSVFEMLKPTNQDSGVIGKILIGKEENTENSNPSTNLESKDQNALYTLLNIVKQAGKKDEDKEEE